MCCRIAAEKVACKALKMRKANAGELLKCIRLINRLQFPADGLGKNYHMASSEPFFYETAYSPVKHGFAIPVDELGHCIVAPVYNSDDSDDSEAKKCKKWKCTAECRLPSNDEVASIIETWLLFKKPMVELRQGLDSIDDGCIHQHFTRRFDVNDPDSEPHGTGSQTVPGTEPDVGSGPCPLLGHPLPCSAARCSSKLFTIRAASVHYPLLRSFLTRLYSARRHHHFILSVDDALCASDFERLMVLCGMKYSSIFKGATNKCPRQENSAAGLPGLELQLQVRHAEIITKFEQELSDDPVHACCSCERLFQRKSVTSMKNCDIKFTSSMWKKLKDYLQRKDGDVNIDSLFVCSYCRPILNDNKMPCRCVLNGLETVEIPAELSGLDALSKQLIQRAKSFQTVVRLGTYTSKVPTYNSLKACKGTMFFLPLPLKKTLETLEEVSLESKDLCPLPCPELYVMVNGRPSKGKVVWRTIVNVDAVKAAICKLRQINCLYKQVDEQSVDDVVKQVIETVDNTTSTMLVKATKEDVADFQSYTIRTLNEKQSATSDIEQYKLLSVKEGPLDNRQKCLDCLCFPVLFPNGKFGEFHPRKIKICSSEYAKSRLLNKDSRFRKDPQYVFFLLWQKEMRELSAGVYNLLKGTRQRAMPVHVFLDKLSKSDGDVEANLSTIFQSMRGSKQYWFLRSSELRCMLREWGTPTLFLTFSCSEYECQDIFRYLQKVSNVPESYPIGKLCCEDPISVSRKFSQKFHCFFNTVLLKGRVLGTVTHYFFKKEYQARGAPHYHAVVWIQDAPTIGKDSPRDVLHWIEERITCRIPEESSNPELHRLVTKYQCHKCSEYCKRRKRFGKTFVTRCRFGYPREVSETSQLNTVDDSLKSRKKIYLLPRSESETRINDYNPLLLLLWKANMDIQFIGEHSLALAHYVTGYITKAERSNMQDIWHEVSNEKSIYSKLWSFGIRSLRSRECGLYEACDLLLGEQLCGKSVSVKWIDAAFPHKRKRRVKDHAKLQQLRSMQPDSSDIFESNLIDTHYPQRPKDLEEVCLYDFVGHYEKVGVDEDGVPMYRKRSKPLLPDHRLYDPKKENQREDYFYSLLLLFVPFRDEASLVNEGETAEQAFTRVSGANSGVHVHHEKLQQMLEAQQTVKEINNARQEEQKGSAYNEQDCELGPCIVGEAKSAIHDLQDLQCKPDGKISLQERISMLNADQARVFHHVSDHLLHQNRHEKGMCKCGDFQPLHMFVSGVGGTGKSFLIEAIRAQAEAIWSLQNSDALICSVAAPTGLAAFNVGGVTLHRLFQLPIEHEGRPAEYWSLPKATQKLLRHAFRSLKLVIVDEVSMISCLNLTYMHLRMSELFESDEWFGSVNTLFVGDLLQLPPVSGGLVFDRLTRKAILLKLGCMTSVNIWKETVVYDELTINERQKDAQFCALLDEVRRGCVSEDSIQTLRGRVMTCSVVNKFKELHSSGQSPVCLFPKRNACEEFNIAMLNNLQTEVIDIQCVDNVDETMSAQKWEANKRANQELQKLNKDSNLTAGLEAVLRIAVGARVMLRRNIDMQNGLVNGALGTVKKIQKHHITVQFDNSNSVHDIERVQSKFIVMKKFYIYREQFPLILAYAITIHKCQGLSLNSAIMDLSSNIFSPGMAYVALSRVKTLSGVHLTAFERECIIVSAKSLEESNRLRGLFRPDLPLFSVKHSTCKRKLELTGECSMGVQPKKAKLSATSSSKLSVVSTSDDVQIVETKKKHISDGSASGSQQSVWPNMRFNPVNAQWQRQMCQLLNVQYSKPNRFGFGGPNCILTLPNLRTVRPIKGDGNCLFRAFSYVVTGSEDAHMAIRKSIIEHMMNIAHLVLGSHIQHNSIRDYVQVSAMDQDSTWGTEIEILVFAHMVKTNVYTYLAGNYNYWWLYSPHSLDRSLPLSVGDRSVYLLHTSNPEHFQVVSSVLR